MKPRQAAHHQIMHDATALHRKVEAWHDEQEMHEKRRELAAKVRGNRGGGKLVSIIVFGALLAGVLIISWR